MHPARLGNRLPVGECFSDGLLLQVGSHRERSNQLIAERPLPLEQVQRLGRQSHLLL